MAPHRSSRSNLLVDFEFSEQDVHRTYHNASGASQRVRLGSREEVSTKIAPLRGLMERGNRDELATMLTEGRLVDWGHTLFDLLFGPDDARHQILRQTSGKEAANPTGVAMRLRIRERQPHGAAPLLADLPWRITAWKGRFLARPDGDHGWHFEIAHHEEVAKRSWQIEAPTRALVVAPENAEPKLPTQAHLEPLDEVLKRAAHGTGQKPEDLRTVVRTKKDLERAAQPPPDVVYYFGHGEVHGDQLCLMLDEGAGSTALSLADLRALLEGKDGRFPQVVYLNGCHTAATGVHGAAYQLLPEIPVVIAECTTAWSDSVALAGLEWFERVYIEEKDPVSAVHATAAGETQRGFQWATTTVATHFEAFDVIRRAPVGRAFVEHNLDRAAQRGIALTQMNNLLGSDLLRVQAFIGWGAPPDAPHLLDTQLREHIRLHATLPPTIRHLKASLSEDDESAERAVDDAVRRALELESPTEDLGAGLYRKAPNAPAGRVPVLWLDFGVKALVERDPTCLTTEFDADALYEWWRFCSQRLPPASQEHRGLRVVVSLTLVPEDPKGFRDWLVTEYVAPEDLQHNAFHPTVLPLLGKVELSDLHDFLKVPEAACRPDLRAALADAIMAKTGGDYAKTLELLAEGHGKWSDLHHRLTGGAAGGKGRRRGPRRR